MKPRFILCLALVSSGGLANIRADMVQGMDWHVAHAEVIEVVQAETPAAAAVFPPPQDKERVWVKDVLKGADTAQEFLLPKSKVQPGQKAVVLFEFGSPGYQNSAVQTPSRELPQTSVWPMDSAGNVNIDALPAHAESGPTLGQFMLDHVRIKSLELIKKNIAAGSPEEVGLYGEVLEALLFPKKFQALARRDARRATYVRFSIAVHQWNRDVPWLARLLESQDQTVRKAALKKLESLTATKSPAPKDNSPQSLQAWAQSWGKRAISPPGPRWPPVPAELKRPGGAFPEPLIQALQRNDADAFIKAFAVWLDSGVMRDREIYYAVATLDRRIIDGSNLEGAFFGTIGQRAAPRLRPDVVLDTNIPTIDRMKAVALLAQVAHYERFVHEWDEAKALVASVPSDSDILRRAAFWEFRELPNQTAGSLAIRRLVQNGEDESSQRFVLALCLDKLDDTTVGAMRDETKAGRKMFIDGMFAYLANHRDNNAQWIGRVLCQQGQGRAIPVMLAWLKDKDPEVRKSGAFNLCWLPSADAVSDLRDAIQSESDREVKGQMLEALAQTGDQRGLEALLAAAREPDDLGVASAIARGLGRIRDPKALPALADMVAGLAWITRGDDDWLAMNKAPLGSWYALSDAVNAFGYISQSYEAHAPDGFWGNSALNPVQLRLDVARIEEWRKSQSNKP
jgi:hypothetical protein